MNISDPSFLRATLEEFMWRLRHAKHEVSFFRREICSLVDETGLPKPFRDAYGRIVSLLATVEQVIEDGGKQYWTLLHEFHTSSLLGGDEIELEPSSALVETVKDTIRQINEAEVRLTRVVRSAKRALLDHAEQGLIDWTNSYNCEFSILFYPGPARGFYETCGFDDAEPMRIRVRPFHDLSSERDFNDPAYNWNIFEGREGHPLRDDHHGYIAHCLFDHLDLPWPLLARFKEIEVEFTLYDFETAWARGEDTPRDHPPAHSLDAVYLADACHELGEVLYRASHEVADFRREFCALVTEPGLPASYRAAYKRIVDLLARIEQAIEDGKKEHLALDEEFHAAGLCRWQESELESSAAVVEIVQDTIRQINEAENRLLNVVKSAKRALMNHAEQGLIDWTNSYSCEFTVLFDPGPARRFYETCAEGEEPLRVRVHPRFHDLADDSSMSDGTENWNVFAGRQGHPLREGHHGYLVHCLFDHIHMPWQLLPHIKAIEVAFTFKDSETLWAAPIVQPKS